MTLSPPRWTLEQFEQGAAVGLANFRNERLNEEPDDYANHFHEVRGQVEDLLELTTDLSTLSTTGGQAVEGYLEALRYVAAPPISEDDLASLSGVEKRYFAASTKWPAVVATIMAVVDRQRFPWLLDGRSPLEAERGAAVLATTSQITASRIATFRRNEAKRLQESLVKASLIEAGLSEVSARQIGTSRNFPEPGTFCGESAVGKSKADLVVGLWDDRILALECKVSNSKVNSVKRIKREAATKAVRWTSDFGTSQIVPAAVIAGVYHPPNLFEAQSDGLTVWWSHDIGQMIEWVGRTATGA